MQKPDKNTACFFTQHLFLIGTYDEHGKENFAPISWVSYTWGQPGCLILSMNGEKQTKQNFEHTKMLSATVVTPDLMRFLETCGSKIKTHYLYTIFLTVSTERQYSSASSSMLALLKYLFFISSLRCL